MRLVTKTKRSLSCASQNAALLCGRDHGRFSHAQCATIPLCFITGSPVIPILLGGLEFLMVLLSRRKVMSEKKQVKCKEFFQTF